MLKSQSVKATHMLDRYDAVFAMRGLALDQKRKSLIEAYHKNSYHAVRSEIVAQLIDDQNQESVALIKEALNDKDVQVRKGVAVNVKNIQPDLLGSYENLLLDSSYVTIATILEKLCFQYPANTEKYLEKTKAIEGTNGRNVKVKWLEIATVYYNSDNKKYVDQLVEYTSNSYEFITRSNAMAALRKLNYYDETLLLNCLQAAVSNNGRLAGPAQETIKYFYNQDKFKKQIIETVSIQPLQNWEKEIIYKLIQ